MPSIYRQTIEAVGLEFKPVRPGLPIDDRDLTRKIMDPARGAEALFNDLLIPGIEASYADTLEASGDADLLITHPAALAGPIVAEATGRPWVSTVLSPVSFFSVFDPMVPPPAPWLHGVLVRSRLASRAFLGLTDRMLGRWTGPVRDLRRRLGLADAPNPILWGQHSPHLVLGLFSKLLAEPQPDWPASTTIVGPILYNGPNEAILDPAIEAFLADGSPPIVFTLGTSAVESAGDFYETAAAAVRRMRRRAVLLTGRHADNRPESDHADILVAEYAPHAAIFPRAAAIVHQGGAGTVHQALAAGRPTLVVPFAHDQPDYARRVAGLGVSRTCHPRHLTVDRLERDLRALLDEPRYAERASEVASIVRSEDGASAACEAMAPLLGAG